MISAAPKLPAYAALAAAGCLLGLALERPEPVLLGAPFLFALVIGAALLRPLSVQASVRLLHDRAVEGEEVGVVVELEAAADVPWVEIALKLPDGLRLTDGAAAEALALAAGEPYQIERTVRCQRWGGYLVGDVLVRSRDPLGFFVWEERTPARLPLRVYPRPEALRALVPPLETQIFAGNEVSRAIGEGIEFAETRPFMPGDRLRRINWRLTSRLGEPYVNELLRERNTDVVLFLDAYAEARRADESTRFQAVRAAATLADRYLQRRDRVGLISFGGILRWLRPAMGQLQRYRILDSLIETDIVFSYVWKEIKIIPPPVLPPKALVIAITPLLDQRAIDALLDLRARRFDLAIVEISPQPYMAPPHDMASELAFRIWQLDREVLRDRFRRLGIPVATWTEGQPFERPAREVQAFRRAARLARA